jgi:hypothetical protein
MGRDGLGCDGCGEIDSFCGWHGLLRVIKLDTPLSYFSLALCIAFECENESRPSKLIFETY